MLASNAKQPEADFECVVLDVKARAPGFYTAAYRTYYVAQAVEALGNRMLLGEAGR